MEIRITNLSFKYQESIDYVLREINTIIPNSKITGIVGKSGSGKTTFVDLICGLLKPTAGNIKYDSLNKINYKDIGYLLQNPKQQFFHKTVEQELFMSAKIHNYKLDVISKRVHDVLKIVNLKDEILKENPLNLSNSDSKKIALAILLMYNPKLLVLDEPTVNLDKKATNEFIKLIKMLKNRYNKTILVISHDIDLIHKISDNVILIDSGKINKEGNKYDVFKEVKNLKQCGLLPPKVILFSDKVLTKKNIKIGYRDEINDLIKDIFRYVK